MKAKVAHKAVRRAVPVKKRIKKRIHAAPPAKKAAAKPAFVEAPAAEATVGVFEAPVEIVFTEPEFGVVEVFETEAPVDVDEL